MARMKVAVRKKHIKAGLPSEKHSCPIALALKAKGCTGVVVDSEALSFTDSKGDAYALVMPTDARHFTEAFDRGEFVTPFTFVVPLD